MKGLKFWLGMAIGVTAIAYFAQDLDVRAFAASWRRIRVSWFLAGVLLFCFSFWLRCPRWKVLVSDLGPVSFGILTKAFFVGMLANRVLPARLGEVARCLVLKKRAGLSMVGLLATVAVEKAFDGLALLTVALFALSALPAGASPSFLEPLLEEHRHKILAGALGLPVFLLAVAWIAPLFEILLLRLERGKHIQFAERILRSLRRGLSVLKKGHHILAVAGVTVMVWATLILSEYCTLRSFGWDLSPSAAVVLCAGIGIAVTVPQAPSYVGVYQLAVQWVLVELFAIPLQEAKAFAVAIWITQIVPVGLIGFVCLRLLGTTLEDATQEE
jgi:uncharacterized protein (TIRG00374 family)